MVAHHFRKRVEKDLERLAVVGKFVLVGIILSVTRFLNGVLNEFGDSVRIGGLRKTEIFRFVFQVNGNVALSKQGIEYGIATDFHTVDGTEIDVRDVTGENVPIEVDDALVGNEPNVVVPIENDVQQVEVHRDEIPFEVRERHEGSERERIVEEEKRREERSKEKREKNSIDNERYVPVAYEKQFRALGHVFRKENFVEFVHRRFPSIICREGRMSRSLRLTNANGNVT